MSIVNREVLDHLEVLKRQALDSRSFESGYNNALRGLDIAIQQLKLIDTVTVAYSVKLEK